MSDSSTSSPNTSGASLAPETSSTASSTTQSTTLETSSPGTSFTTSSTTFSTASSTTSSDPFGAGLASGTASTASSTAENTSLATSSSPISTALPTNTGHHGSSVSSGAVAGIAIATFIVGALLGSIGVWFYLRRKRASKTPWSSENGYSKGNATTNHGVVISKDPTTQMQNYLIAERADDSQLRHQMQNLGELIYQHVENHYTTGPHTGSSQDFTATLKKCGYSERTDPTISTLGSLLGNSSERQTAIKNLIAWVILKGVELNRASEYSLLPDEITTFYRSALKDNKQLNKQDAAYVDLLSRVRQLSTQYISSSKSPEDASKEPSVARVVNLLNSILQPFIKPSSKSSQFENLASIVYQGREFGLLLLAQPGNWIFGWEATTGVESNTRNHIVVFPSLDEVINRDGKERRRVVSEQERETV
ncbi:hypothetical protein BOTCAL_0070g00180 [Botryotinia calthae]|uniref:Uncharacterized protein n=1 Tax=Botryotinia calthae TaxID=38488 RepID=A0A4Y8DBA2_9HELO|nr:hypothetical protein BOTCAL_0070g00180 [Botryotinia calthae]